MIKRVVGPILLVYILCRLFLSKVSKGSQNNNDKPFWLEDGITDREAIRRSLRSFPSSPLRIMRVSQLDADLLDIELFDILKEQLWRVFALFKVNTIIFRILGDIIYAFRLEFYFYRYNYFSLTFEKLLNRNCSLYYNSLCVGFLFMSPELHMVHNYKI